MADSRAEIENLLYTYTHLIDSGDSDGLADLFAHGEITVEPGEDVRVDRVGTYRGRDQIMAFYGPSSVPPAPRGFLHFTANSLIEIDEDAGTATARSYYQVVHSEPSGGLGILVAGQSRDRFARIDVRWCFASRSYGANLSSNGFRAFGSG